MVGIEPLHEDPGRSVGPPRVKDNLHGARTSEPVKRQVDGASPRAAFSAGNGLESRRNEVGSEPFQRGDVEGFLFHFVYPNRGASLRRVVAPAPTAAPNPVAATVLPTPPPLFGGYGKTGLARSLPPRILRHSVAASVSFMRSARFAAAASFPNMAAACSTCPADNGGSTGVPRTESSRGLTPAWRKRSAMHWSVRARSTSHSLPATSLDRHASKVTNSRDRPPGRLSPRWVSRIWRTSLTMGL